MKLKTMTDAQLHRIIDIAQGELALRQSKRHNQQKLKVIAEKMLKEHGVSLPELFGSVVKNRKVAPKWRHKEDASLTWAGRGRQPKWIKKYGVKI